MKKLLLLLLAVLVLGGGAWLIGGSSGNEGGSQPNSISSPKSIDPAASDSGYILYSEQALAEATQDGGRAVLFFHADWCPTCRAAEQDILSKLDQIPDDLTILKTDYDTERELKKKYQVVVQHTFVQVDQNGNEVTKWSGGGLQDIINLTETN